MASGSGEVRIWVKVAGRRYNRRPTHVSVECNDTISELIDKALEKELLEGTVAPGLVKVTFDDGEVRADVLVSDYPNTTYSNPLLLQIEEDEGM